MTDAAGSRRRTTRPILVTAFAVAAMSAAPQGQEAVQTSQTTLQREAPGRQSSTADLLLTNGFIYTVNPEQPVARAVAVRDGEILFVGGNRGARRFADSQTQVVDLGGRMAMPGVNDVHVHLIEALHAAHGTCFLPVGMDPEDYLPILQACAPNQIGTNWVLGYGHSIFDLRQYMDDGSSPRALLDSAISDRPVAILEFTSHSAWVNSRALDALGFDATTPDPVGGVILREPGTNEPNGILLDAAGEMAMDMALMPNATLEQLNYDALLAGMALANENGITSVCDARCYWRRGYDDTWTRARDEGTLSLRVVVGLWAYPYESNDTQQIADLIARYSNDPESLLRFSQVKLYSDGEIEHNTAALLQPYDVDPFFFAGPLAGPLGINYFDEPRLTTYVTQLEQAGFDCHIHTIGDRGVNEALDSIADARSTNGDVGARHRLTHVSLVAPADVNRFSTLDVTADFQPQSNADFNFFYGIYLAPIILQTEAQRVRTLYDAGARVVLSSDYDVGSISPFVGMRRSLQLGGQSLPDIHAAIRAYTMEAAYVMRQEDRVGSIEVGKRADIIVLDRNIVQIPTNQIAGTSVLLTLLDGEEVWRDPSF